MRRYTRRPQYTHRNEWIYALRWGRTVCAASSNGGDGGDGPVDVAAHMFTEGHSTLESPAALGDARIDRRGVHRPACRHRRRPLLPRMARVGSVGGVGYDCDRLLRLRAAAARPAGG